MRFVTFRRFGIGRRTKGATLGSAADRAFCFRDRESMKRPAFQFYPADWRKDVELRSCSVAARGLWVDLMCLAHECEPYGHLTVNGQPMTSRQMAGQLGLTPTQTEKLLGELLKNGVARRTDGGVVFSKRMVEDESAREARAAIGRANGGKGAEFGKLGAEHGKKGGRPKNEEPPAEPGEKPPQNPRPSSSSSSSSSASTFSEAIASGGSPPPQPVDLIYGLGLPLLLAASVPDKNARSMLGLMRKQHGDAAVIAAVQSMADQRPLEPVAWLQACLRTGPIREQGGARSFRERDADAARADAARWGGGLAAVKSHNDIEMEPSHDRLDSD